MSCFSTSKYFDWNSHCAMFFSQNIHLCGTVSEIQSSYSSFWEMLTCLSHLFKLTVPIMSVQERISALLVMQYKGFWFSSFTSITSRKLSPLPGFARSNFNQQHPLKLSKTTPLSFCSSKHHFNHLSLKQHAEGWLTRWKSQTSFNWDFTSHALLKHTITMCQYHSLGP